MSQSQSPAIAYRDRRALLERSGRKLISIAERDITATTDRYPGWSVGQLLIHVSRVYRFVTPIVKDSLDHPPSTKEEPPEGGQEVPFFLEGLFTLIETFDTADPASPCWGYGPRPSIASWLRRMALETEVHRWDAASAFGQFDDLDSAIAADGIDELRHMWLPWVEGPPLEELQPGPLVVLEAKDVGVEWTVEVVAGSARMTRGRDPECSNRISGPASDLYLHLLGRRHAPLEQRVGRDELIVLKWLIDHMAEATI